MSNTSYRLYIDDIRTPQSDFDCIVRTSQDAIAIMEEKGCPSYISFDHDLGPDSEYDSDFIVQWMIEKDLDNPNWIPSNFSFHVHSANPIGKKNIESKLSQYLSFLLNKRKNTSFLSCSR